MVWFQSSFAGIARPGRWINPHKAPLLARRCEFLSSSDEYRPEIVHIGESRTTDHLIVECLEEAVGVILLQSGARRQTETVRLWKVYPGR